LKIVIEVPGVGGGSVGIVGLGRGGNVQ
jgi:hypothetical protein